MTHITLMPADIVTTRGHGVLAKLVRFFTRYIGEKRTRINHVGVVVEGGDPGVAVIVEALATVQRRRLLDGYGGRRASSVAVFRPINMTEEEKQVVVRGAESYVGRKYGRMKLLAHLADWFLLGAYVFRRLARNDRYPICSWLVAHAFGKAGRHFGVKPGAANPDHIWDFVTGNPDKYQVIIPLGELRRYLD